MIHIAVSDLDTFTEMAYMEILAKNGALGRHRLKRILKARNPGTQRERAAASLLLLWMKKYYCLKEPFLYNLSHSGNRVLCVVEDDRKGAKVLGCDIEKTGPVRRAVVKRAFSEEERAFLQAEKDKDKAFTKIWTLKESCVKALRTGISVPLQEVAFDFSGEEIALADKTVKLNFKVMDCQDGYGIAVCSDGEIDEKIRYINLESGGIYG